MATPTDKNISITRNTDNDLEFIIKDDLGAVIDITNDTVKFTAVDSFAGPTRIATKTNGVGQHSDPTNGKTKFVIAKEDIDDEVSRSIDTVWIYEVRRIKAGAGSDEFVHYMGKLTVKPSVT